MALSMEYQALKKKKIFLMFLRVLNLTTYSTLPKSVYTVCT